MNPTFESAANRISFGDQTVAGNNGPVKVMIGPYRSGKTLALIDDVIAFCRRDPFGQALIVVPSQRYRKLFEERLLERLAIGRPGTDKTVGLAGLHILPFYKACQLLMRRSGVPFRIVPESVRSAIIARVLSQLEAEGEIKTLQPIIGFSGTHAALLELIDELERAALSPDELLLRLERTAQSESRYIELARIYERYWHELKRLAHIDERGAAFAAREILSQKEAVIEFGLVAADGFDRFNPLQLHVLEGLSQKAAQTRITFDYVPPEHDQGGDYVWKQTSYEELQATFKTAHRVEFNPTAASPTPTPALRKMQMLDRYFEASEVARSIKKRLSEAVSPERILVVARGISAYTVPIQAAFDDAGINYFVDETMPLQHLPLVQVVLHLIELACVSDFKRADVFLCLRSPYFRLSLFAESEKELNKLEQLSFSEQIIETREQWLEVLARHNDKFGDRFCQGLTQLLNDVTPPVSGSLREFVVWVENLIDRYIVLPSAGEDNPFRKWEEHRGIYELRRCLAGLIQEENILGASINGGDYFLSRVRTLVERANFRRQQKTPDAVTICGADLAPNISYDEVYVLGMAEGEFPKRARETGFLSADEVARWLSFGVDLRNPRYHPAFEAALFSSLVNRARNTAHLSCPVFDVSGEELLPSYFLTGGKSDSALAVVHPFDNSASLPVSPRDAVAGLLWQSHGASVDALKTYLPLTMLVESLSEPIRVAKLRAYSGARAEFNGDLRDFVSTKTLSVQVPAQWSPTKLNDYGKCPFRYWTSHVLKVKPAEEPMAGLTPLIIGDTYHKALELFYRTLLARNLRLDQTDLTVAQGIFNGAVNAALALLESRGDVRRGEFWKYERKEIAFRLNRFFAKEWQRCRQDQDQFVATMNEAAFGLLGDPESHAHLKIRDGSRELLVRGRIDRIDVALSTMSNGQRRVRIIDYKAGSSAISKEDALRGRNIQLPLYALAVERSIMPGSKVVSGSYLSVSSGESIGRLSFEPSDKGGEDDVNLLELVEEHVRNFVSGIESGDFTVRPNGASVCTNCPHKSVCRIKELLSAKGGEQ